MAILDNLICYMPLTSDLSLTIGTGSATYSRDSDATYIDAATGLVTKANWVKNLTLRSEEFDNAVWLKEGGGSPVVAPNVETDPIGGMSADTITYLSGLGNVRQTTTSPSASKTYTFSVWLKSISGATGNQRIFFRDTGNTEEFALNFSVTTEWVRYVVSGTFTASPVTNVEAIIRQNVSQASVIAVWGAQLEEDSSASEYVMSSATEGVTHAPRFEAEGYLSEGASTNLITWSEDLSSGNWLWNTATAATDGTLAPDGVTQAYAVAWASASLSNHIRIDFGTLTGIIVGSFFYKQGTSAGMSVRIFEGGGVDRNFNLNTSTDTDEASGAFDNIEIEILTNGWRRVCFTASGYTSTGAINLRLGGNGIGSGTGNTYVWGVQVEVLERASSYIPTAGTPKTRARDALEIPSANWPALNTDFSVAVTVQRTTTDLQHYVYLEGVSPNTYFGTSGAGQPRITFGGVTTSGPTVGDESHRQVGTWELAGTQSIYKDTTLIAGPAATANDTGSLFSVHLAANSIGASPIFGHLKELRIYDIALDIGQVQEDFDFVLSTSTPTVNQAMFDGLTRLGYTGTVNSMQIDFLNSFGIQRTTLGTMWKVFFDAIGVPATGAAARFVYFYETQLLYPAGTSNLSINELKLAYWLSK
tara:strand:+ start:1304 stop:3238 length:1935 start_codon:yes stop_codon:yes gene_type:complete